jgi:hypothetical protein
MTEYEVPETRQYRCYKLGNTLFVPHYTIPKMYVGPSKRVETGFIKANYPARYFYEQELKRMNATIVVEQLWSTPARNGE